jgi:hypothetical protein
MEKWKKILETKDDLYNFCLDNLLIWAENKISKSAMRKFLFGFCFGSACRTIMFAMATRTNISCSLGRQDGPVLSLSFLDDYDYD